MRDSSGMCVKKRSRSKLHKSYRSEKRRCERPNLTVCGIPLRVVGKIASVIVSAVRKLAQGERPLIP